LEQLHLQRNNIAGVESLAGALRHNTSLWFVNLVGNRGVSVLADRSNVSEVDTSNGYLVAAIGVNTALLKVLVKQPANQPAAGSLERRPGGR
jgi:hypothetical protein